MFRDRFYSTRPPRSYRKRTDVYYRRSNEQLVMKILFFAVVVFILAMIFMLYTTLRIYDQALQHTIVTSNSVDHVSGDGGVIELRERDQFNQRIVDAADRVNQAVVSVIRYQEDQEGQHQQVGIGSGVIFEQERGKVRVVTNYHVIDGGDAFEVVLYDETRKNAKVIGKDMLSDLAVLEMSEEGVQQYAVFGDSSQLQVGDVVLAIGNPLGLGFSHTTTFGVISSTNRTIPVSLSNNGFYDWEMNMIQTDAAINRGNSGGALVNLDGEVIGINNMKVSNFGVEGLGFAIPSNTAVPIIQSLIAYGKVKRPFIGVATLDYDYVQEEQEIDLPQGIDKGLLVITVSGPAKKAGIQPNDFIVALDQEPISSTIQLRKYLYEHKAIGEELAVTFYRNRQKQTVLLTLGETN